ncbi:FapA family protein [Clostridium sp. KNHs205]|uniref:DUF342 domain-containing protein n=1 Tax=Clostridium sp. KNHs205 TaxID=1449050 RepID=UPI0006897CA1|nr:FapA family protein [Clostridium sp. KNHs205]
MVNRNGYFQLVIKADGTYIRLIPGRSDGKALEFNDVVNYFSKIQLYDYDVNALARAINTSKDKMIEIKLTPAIFSQVNELLDVSISPDRMYVEGYFYPPVVGGKMLTKNDILDILKRAGVKYGVIEDIIDAYLINPIYNEMITLARGLKPIEGKDAEIIYYFNTDKTLKPKEKEDGTVDFHQLDMISSINKGDLLAVLEPEVYGKPGIDVTGNAIPPRKVTKKVLKHSRDIHLSEDGLKMYSDVSGHVELVNGKVFVSNTYEVLADVDSSTGDIDYEGNVTVKGNVRAGYSIKAKGDIIVDGVVEGARLYATGQIVLKRGMQGMNKGIMEAEGNIISKFFENAVVKSGGYVSTEAILHSKISARGDIIVGGKKGFITGGEITSGTSITVKTAGSTMGTFTQLEVGIDPKKVEQYREVQKRIAAIDADLDKLLPIIETYKRKISQGEKLSPEKLEYIRLATNNCIQLRTEYKECQNKFDMLRVEIGNSDGGWIKVENVAYPGVKIVISNVNYHVKTETHYSKFIRDRADIKVVGL